MVSSGGSRGSGGSGRIRAIALVVVLLAIGLGACTQSGASSYLGTTQDRILFLKWTTGETSMTGSLTVFTKDRTAAGGGQAETFDFTGTQSGNSIALAFPHTVKYAGLSGVLKDGVLHLSFPVSSGLIAEQILKPGTQADYNTMVNGWVDEVAAAAASSGPSPSAGLLPTQFNVPSPFGDGTCPKSQPAALPAGESRMVTIQTHLGDIVIKVEGALSPIAAGNFVALATCHFYDGLTFHRTPSFADGTPFVLQGGDPTGTGAGGPGYTIQDEPVTATYQRGTVALARTPAPESQGSQFFIVLDDKAGAALAEANTYAIFGEVISGMDVADAIFDASDRVELPTNAIPMISVRVSGV